MTTTGGGAGVDAAGMAPFVAKTYRMVDDPATDAAIAWGRDNNSFVVADPFAFSQTLLPAHFKHSNFSSFVRQLNTYGFRKVDPDRWEFAHVSFLRGQTHLLRQIVRRSSGAGGKQQRKDDDADATVDDDAVAMEVVRLRREQRAIEDQVAAMWRRVQETERRPKQMLAFLVKVAGDPQVLRRLVSSSSGAAAGTGGAGSDGGVGLASSGPEDSGREVAKRARLLLEDGGDGPMVYGGGSSDDAAVDDFVSGFYSASAEDVGFGAEGGGYLQPPPYVFPVNSGY
ncbi:Heat stress transcription factor C-2a [Dichanthelium oligosanthes]|uniref:Heat stress transcription factor C-2a n=1 Tax=Dichanthelium oligosanthes TaxID=888268 RepID=A0A1E5VEP6_9POAL|nr:Heat stress transcription factor C-2a [Dichanthelium oligosanthes]